MSGDDDLEFRDFDREEWADDLKNCPALQLKSPTGDFSWSVWERGRQYAEYRRARREEKARQAAAAQRATARVAAIDEAEHRETRDRSTGLVLASTRPRSLFIRARVHSGHTCEREHVESGVESSRPVASVPPAPLPAPLPVAPASASDEPAPQPPVIDDEVKPHDLLLSFLDAIGVDSTKPWLVNKAIENRLLRRAIAREKNYRAKLFFELLRSHKARFWDIDTLEAAGDKIRAVFRKRHLEFTTIARQVGVTRRTIRLVGKVPGMRMSTLMAIGTPAGFLNGRFSVALPSAGQLPNRVG